MSLNYSFLACSNTVVNALTVARVNSLLYPPSVKVEQIEAIFKRSTVGTTVLAIGLRGSV